MSEALARIEDRGDNSAIIIHKNPVAAALAKLAENPTPENVASMQKLTELGIQYRKMDAEEWFNADFAEMQENMPDIICDKKGAWGGEYADKESLMRQIRPTLKKYGFSVRFNHPAGANEGQLVTECVLSHKGGHSVKNSIFTRAGRPNKMMTEIQVDAGGYYAGERYALSAMLNIRADKADDDARFLGMALTDDELAELRQHAEVAGADIANLCRQAGVEKIEDVRTGALRLLHNFLNEKQRINAKKSNAGAESRSKPVATASEEVPPPKQGDDSHPFGSGLGRPLPTSAVGPTGRTGGVTPSDNRVAPASPAPPLDNSRVTAGHTQGVRVAELDQSIVPSPNAGVVPTATPAQAAKAWVEATSEADLLQALSENPRQTAKAKLSANVQGILEEFDSRDLKRVAYCWKLARLTEKK